MCDPVSRGVVADAIYHGDVLTMKGGLRFPEWQAQKMGGRGYYAIDILDGTTVRLGMQHNSHTHMPIEREKTPAVTIAPSGVIYYLDSLP